MTARRVGLLLAAGLVIIAFAIWMASGRNPERSTTAGDLVLPGLEHSLNGVTEVRISKGDGTQTTLKKGASDWTVGERDYPADSGKVRKLLLDLGALNVIEEKTRLADNYPQLGVEDVNSPKSSGTRVDLVTPAKAYSIILGKSSSGKSGYVRVSNAQQSYLSAPLVTVDAEPKRWLDHTLLDIPQTRVKEVEAKPASGPAYTASREKKEQTDFTVSNIPKGRELASPSAADSIAGALASITLDDVRRASSAAADAKATDTKAADGKDAKTASGKSASADAKKDGGATANPKVTETKPTDTKPSEAIFRTFDGLELAVTGRKDGTTPYLSVVARSTAKETESEAQALNARLNGWEFEIPAYKYDEIFRPMEDLLKKPPEPAKKDEKSKKADAKSGAAGKSTTKADKQPAAATAK